MYSSYRRLPTIKNYAQALALLEKTKPIRGRAPVLYPLGDRRYADHFAIRKFGDNSSRPATNERYYGHTYNPAPDCGPEDVELLLYRCPVIVFHTDATITVTGHHGYWSSADLHFMQSILYKYVSDAFTRQGVLMLKLRNPDRTIAIPRKGSVRLKIDNEDTGVLTLVSPDESLTHTVRLNRKAANEVRKQYGQFYRYAKGMVGVRKEAVQTNSWSRQSGGYEPTTEEIVKFYAQEILDALPPSAYVETPPHTAILNKSVAPLLTKPAKQVRRQEWKDGKTVHSVDTQAYQHWLRTANEYLELISAPQDDPEQHTKFARALALTAMHAVYSSSHVHYRVHGLQIPKDYVFKLEPHKVMQTIDGIVFRYHANEVFERVPAREGEVPSVQYMKWLDREEE